MMTDFFRWFMDSAWKSEGAAVTGMFYPVVPNDTAVITERHASDFARLLGGDLRDAITYQVTSEMVGMMAGLSRNMPEKIPLISQAELPCDAGFAWLDTSWVLHDAYGQPYEIRALSWKYMETWTRGTETDDLGVPRRWPCCRITLWALVDDDVEQGTIPGERARDMVDSLGRLQLSHSAVIPFELRFTRPAGLSPERSVDSFLTLVHILWMLLGMEIVSTAKAPVPRHFRRRAQRSIKHGEVHVVLLRKIRHATEPEEHHQVDWSCRWVVQGHYRHIDPPEHAPHHAIAVGMDKHCAQCGGRLAWVRPYIKGPDGRPLKTSETLWKLAR